jgi:hypothetical protein
MGDGKIEILNDFSRLIIETQHYGGKSQINLLNQNYEKFNELRQNAIKLKK